MNFNFFTYQQYLIVSYIGLLIVVLLMYIAFFKNDRKSSSKKS